MFVSEIQNSYNLITGLLRADYDFVTLFRNDLKVRAGRFCSTLKKRCVYHRFYEQIIAVDVFNI